MCFRTCIYYTPGKCILTSFFVITLLVFLGLTVSNIAQHPRWLETTCLVQGYDLDCQNETTPTQCKGYIWAIDADKLCTGDDRLRSQQSKNFGLADTRVLSAKILLFMANNQIGSQQACWILSDCSQYTIYQPIDLANRHWDYWLGVGIVAILSICIFSSLLFLLALSLSCRKQHKETEQKEWQMSQRQLQARRSKAEQIFSRRARREKRQIAQEDQEEQEMKAYIQELASREY